VARLHLPFAVLSDADAQDVIDWLQAHPVDH
jgi:hypothetical protein